jgi:hypothetical protein
MLEITPVSGYANLPFSRLKTAVKAFYLTLFMHHSAQEAVNIEYPNFFKSPIRAQNFLNIFLNPNLEQDEVLPITA